MEYTCKKCLQEKLDAIFLISKPQVYNAIYDFSDYFECKFDEENNLIGIKIQASRNIDDLEYRFMGYLPNTIFEFLMNAVKNYAA